MKFMYNKDAPLLLNHLLYLPNVSIIPEILKPIRRQHGVADGVLDIFVPKVVLDGTSVLAVIA